LRSIYLLLQILLLTGWTVFICKTGVADDFWRECSSLVGEGTPTWLTRGFMISLPLAWLTHLILQIRALIHDAREPS